MEKDTEQRRAEIREELSAETGENEENRDPEGHEPLPGLVGNRIKEASETWPIRFAFPASRPSCPSSTLARRRTQRSQRMPVT